MTARYRERLFTEAVREAQAALNGRALGPAPGDGAEGPGRCIRKVGRETDAFATVRPFARSVGSLPRDLRRSR